MSLALLSSCEVKALEVNGNDDLDDEQLGELLRSRATRYKHCLLKAVQLHCERREDTPSVEEIARIYTFTNSGDPLRSLVGDVFTSRGKSRITDIAHVEFQRELNASLLEEMAELRVYVNRVQSMRSNIKELKGYNPGFYGQSNKDRLILERTMRQLVEIEPPRPRQPDAARYHEETLL
jgi:hypothetical protein